ncbi:MAG: Ig-like domain-containing protein [Thermoplasmatota archaeon]
MRRHFIDLLLAAVLLTGSAVLLIQDENGSVSAEDKVLIWDIWDTYSDNVWIGPGDSFHVMIDSASHGIIVKEQEPLADACYDALESIPVWLRSNLTYKFGLLPQSDQTALANLIINSPDERFVDEIAFCIAHSSLETLRDDYFFPEILTHNARLVYDTDQYLDYVEIIELDDRTTLRYKSEDNSTWDLPADLYYWYVVHPKLGDELPTYVDPDYNYVTDPPFDRNYGTPPPTGKFWRDRFFNHNKTGQPLLKDSLSNANTLLDGIKAINGWISRSMTFTSDNERPVQPVRIYEKGIGRCGEYQDMRCAAARTALIPVVPTMNSAEDHVWNEFWDGRWIHWDGTIDNPMMYERGWGKTISSVWNMRPDGYIWSVTGKYSSTCTLKARVVDSNGLPADGALVAIETENYYQNDIKTTTIWDSVTYDGNMSLEIGDGRNFWASAEGYDLGSDPPGILGPELIISDSEEGEEYEVLFELPQSAPSLPVIQENDMPDVDGGYRIEIEYRVVNNILRGRNRMTGDRYDLFGAEGDVDFFIADDMNFRAYERGLGFNGYELSERSGSGATKFNITEEGDWYGVLSNEFSQWTTKIVNVSVKVYSFMEAEITVPFENGSVHTIGEILEIGGTARSPWGVDTVRVSWVDGTTWSEAADTSGNEPAFSTWRYGLDTDGLPPGEINIFVMVDDGIHMAVIDRSVTLMDVTPPEMVLEGPIGETVLGPRETVRIWGSAGDENGILRIECRIDGDLEGKIEYQQIEVSRDWSFTLDSTFMDPGDHEIEITALDTSYNENSTSLQITVGESIPPKVRIDDPEEGTLYRQGDTISIFGRVTDNVGAEKLRVSVDGGSEKDMSDDLKGEHFTIEVETDRLSDGFHTAIVRAFDRDGNQGEDSIDFEIDARDPVIELEEDYLGYYHAEGDPLSIIGRIIDERGVGSIWISVDGGPDIDMSSYLRHIRFDMPVPGAESMSSGYHYIEIRATDLVGNDDRISIDLNVDGGEPALYLEGVPSVVMRGEELTITGYVLDPSGIDDAYLHVSGYGRMDIHLKEDGYFTVDLDTGLLSVGETILTLHAADRAGNTAAVSVTFHSVVRSTDTDGDGIPDWWEYMFPGLDPFVFDSDDDPDGDGYSNLREYLGRDGKPDMDDYSDPTDPDSKPVDPSSGALRIFNILYIVIPIVMAVLILVGVFLITRMRGGKS